MTTIIHTPTKNLEESRNFYQKLNYELISETNPDIFTDGVVLVEINPNRYARAGIKIYQASWAKEAENLKKKTALHPLSDGYLLNDFNGCWIYLIEDEFKFKSQIEVKSQALTGNFSGLSLESSDMQKSLEIWQIIGFSINMGNPDSGYLILKNSVGFTVSLMKPLTCPHLFFNPSMTFFNGKENLDIIEKIKTAGIPIAEEITHFNKDNLVDNIIIRDPGGYGFFIFND